MEHKVYRHYQEHLQQEGSLSHAPFLALQRHLVLAQHGYSSTIKQQHEIKRALRTASPKAKREHFRDDQTISGTRSGREEGDGVILGFAEI